jgi:type I restriction enzyme S subunit
MIEIIDIPKHWQVKRLGEVCEVLDNLRKPINSTERQHRIAGKSQNELFPYYGATGQVGWIDSFLTNGDYVLIGEDGAPFLDIYKDKAYKIKGKTWVNNHAHILKGKEQYLINDYALYYLNSINYREYVNGTTRLKLTKSNLVDIQFILPPLPEQQAIVAKIEELFSDLDNGKQQLQTAQQQLKVYRQSLLKWAFEGKLTNKDVKEGELPVGWKLKELKDITTVQGDGLHGTPKYSDSGEYYFINGNNLNDGKIEIKENTKRISLEEFNKYKKPLNENTILVSINGSLGYTAFYNNEKVVLGKSACYFNVLEIINKFYIRYFLTSNQFTSYANKKATGSTIKNVGLKAMRELQIPIPPTLQEQQLIVDELESKLTVCDKIEETISQSLLQVETLRQSILKKAFEGKLVQTEVIAEKKKEII